MLKSHISIACLILFVFSMLATTPDALAAHEIIGAPKCKACHKAKTGDQWKIWMGSAHARAFETLASAASKKIAVERGIGDPQQEEECLKCHTTRAFLGVDVPVSDKGKYADNEGVGCESCHGPGSNYKPGKIMRDPEAARAAGLIMERTAEACKHCHNETSPTYKPFDFEQRWAEIAHPVPGEEEEQTDALAANPGMPDVVTFSSSAGNVFFPHKLHVEDLDLECVKCHHQISAVKLETPHPDYLESSWINCQLCHDPYQQTDKTYYKCSECHHENPNNITDETLSSK
ncbi:MAG: multiheme c-type cytochrome, partial [Xanthomonadales bacterium]|nr:multiheme c-type cytochrome [Xanthomonadales bacterium]